MPGGVQVGVGYIDVRPDLTRFGRELQTGMSRNVKKAGDTAASSLKGSFANAAKGAAAAFGAAFATIRITDFIGSSIKAASDLGESMGKVGVVFDKDAGKIRSFAKTAATAIGQSEQQALEAAGTFGNLFVSMGIGTGVAADMSIKLVKLASDLASLNNSTPADALDALRSGLVGETEPLRRYGANLNDATLKQKALELGLIRSTKAALEPAIKAQAVYALVFEQTKTAQGDFARTSGNLANQQRSLTAQWADAKAELGEGLLPAMVSATGFMTDQMLPAFKSLFTSGDFDPTNWGAKIRDVIGDVVGFLLGAIQQTLRAMASVADVIPHFGDEWAADMRAAADALDPFRDKLHASTLEISNWANAGSNAWAAAKLLAPATKEVTAATKASVSATKEAAEAADDFAKAQRDLLGAQRDLADAERGLKKARVDRDKAAAAFAALPTDTNAEKLAEADEALLDATDGVADAKDRELDAHEKVSDAEDKMVGKTGAFVGAVNARTEAVKALNDQFGITEAHLGILGDVGNITGQTTGKVLPPPPSPPAPGFAGLYQQFGPASTSPATPAPASAKVDARTQTINVNVTQPVQDPGLIGKAVAWALD